MPDAVGRRRLAAVLLWLFVINLGIGFGAGLYEGTIVVGDWLVVSPDGERHWDAAAALRDDTGRRFWVFVAELPPPRDRSDGAARRDEDVRAVL